MVVTARHRYGCDDVWGRRGLALLCLMGALVPRAASGQEEAPPAPSPPPPNLVNAAEVQAATRQKLAVLGDAFACADARFVSYRRSDADPEITDQWYVASQLWADAFLLNDVTTPPIEGWNVDDARCYIDKGFVFLDRLWDYTTSGYFPQSNPAGTTVKSGPRFSDDNMVAGLALLETARTTNDPLAKRRYIHAAEREADFLIGSGMWDDTFGGGFWWNTGKGDTEEGKPAQTNALASLFFARLFAATGNGAYRDWALNAQLWLDTILWDPSKQLYRWSVGFTDMPHRTGARIQNRYFNYDQGIAIESLLAAAKLDADASHVSRAQAVGRATHAAFWSSRLGGYNLETGVDQVYTSYAAWTSLGHLALYAEDASAEWLNMARQNVDGLSSRLREPDGGYAYRTYQCVNSMATGCAAGPSTIVVDRTRDAAAQAWAQHLQTALADRLKS
jgi:Glycosyl hydrolase family 76